MKQFKTNSEKDIIQYQLILSRLIFHYSSYDIKIPTHLRRDYFGPITHRGGGEVKYLNPFLKNLVPSWWCLRSKSVCMIAGNSVKSIIYVSINGVRGWAYFATYSHRNSVLCSQDTSPSIVYYTFYRISDYNAYIFRSEIFVHH